MDRLFRCLTGLDFATDEVAIKRILAGEDVPWKERKMRQANPGQIVKESDLPPRTVNYALAHGYIEEVQP